MVRLIPSRVTDAEPFFLVTRRNRQVDGGAVIQCFVGIIPAQIGEETADANPGSGAGITVFDRRGRTHKVKWNACVNSKVTRKVVSQCGAEIVDPTIAAVASFELGSQRDSGSETSGIIFCRPGRRRRWRLSIRRGWPDETKCKHDSQPT